jgi:hypothetical protein
MFNVFVFSYCFPNYAHLFIRVLLKLCGLTGVQTVPSSVSDVTAVSSNASPVLSTNVVDTSTLPNVDTALPTVPSTSSLKKYKDSDKNSDCEFTDLAEHLCVYP